MEPQFQKNLIVNNKQLKYKGIFKADELFRTINQALDEKEYEKREKKTEELVTEKGRQLRLELRPIKEKTTYVFLMIKIKVDLDNVTDIVLDRDGIMERFHNGDVTVTFDSWILTDYEHRWGMRPYVYFIKGLINKFLYTWPQEAAFPGEVAGDTAQVYVAIQKLLNSYSPKDGRQPTEEEVRRKIQEEMQNEQEMMEE